MKERVILHSDLNNFYASVESLYHPELRGRPMAVLGDPEARHGIVLAKNYEAKAYDVKTGDTMWQAKKKCPGIVFVSPHYELYKKYSDLVRKIYSQYTDKVEPFGLDECWLDVTGSRWLYGDGKKIADELRGRIKLELGLSVSVGVSFNKIFAKLGSDLKKPDATTVIGSENFKEIVWKLPVNDLLYAGRSTCMKLNKKGVFTIGELAAVDAGLLRSWLGKAGVMLWRFANGLDDSPVSDINSKSEIKTVGNSTTTPKDLVTDSEIKITLNALSESVSSRLRKYGFVCRTVQVGIRGSDLTWIERQGKLELPNRTAKSIFSLAWELVKNNPIGKPIRSLAVRACDLEPAEYVQMSFFDDFEKIHRQERLEEAEDKIRKKFGADAIQKTFMLTDLPLSAPDSLRERSGISFGDRDSPISDIA